MELAHEGNRHEALQAVDDATEAATKMKRAIEGQVVGPILVAWGVAWMGCYSVMALSIGKGAIVGMILFTAAGIATAFCARGNRLQRFRVRKSNKRRLLFHSILWPCVSLALFVANRERPLDVSAVVNLGAVGLAYLFYGAVLRIRSLLVVGPVLVTVAVLGYWGFREHLFIWSALSGGLGFAGPGVYFWRQA